MRDSVVILQVVRLANERTSIDIVKKFSGRGLQICTDKPGFRECRLAATFRLTCVFVQVGKNARNRPATGSRQVLDSRPASEIEVTNWGNLAAVVGTGSLNTIVVTHRNFLSFGGVV